MVEYWVDLTAEMRVGLMDDLMPVHRENSTAVSLVGSTTGLMTH